MSRARVLTVAGSDPSGGAGVQADLAVFAAFACHGMAVVTALTVQDTRGVSATHPVPRDVVAAQIDALFGDCPPLAVKTGMLPTSDAVRAVAAALARHRGIPVVVDPVAVAGDGRRLIDADAERALVSTLLPLAAVVTPNSVEASAMTGLDVRDVDGAAAAGRRLTDLGARAALVKGGHAAGGESIDVLVESGRAPVFFARPRIATVRRVHGTGCALSAALAASLARGVGLERAARDAGDYVHAAIAAAYAVGSGALVLDFAAGAAGVRR